MKSLILLVSSAFVGAVVLTVIGCSGESDKVTDSDRGIEPAILRIFPANGAVAVSTGVAVGVRFNTPMDTSSVMAGFHLSGGSDMQVWMDSVDHIGGMAHMNMNQQGQMMQWMDSLQFDGHFAWNESLDSCTFHPDSVLEAGTDHMIFMFGQMKSRGGVMMDMGGGMMVSDTGFTYHFRTAQ